MNEEEVFEQLLVVLEDLFETDPTTVTLDSKFYEDLDIDSIDAVDLMVRLKEISGQRVDPVEFKNIRTIAQCIGVVQGLYEKTENT